MRELIPPHKGAAELTFEIYSFEIAVRKWLKNINFYIKLNKNYNVKILGGIFL